MIAIAAHDAGGAEIISSYVKQNGLECVFALAGPAVAVFERKLGPVEILPLEQALNNCEWLLAGTGWQSELEWTAIDLARRTGRKSVAFLDHWANYAERFRRNGRDVRPDEIWVGDDEALAVAQTAFTGVSIRLMPNPYLAEMVAEIHRLGETISRSNLQRVLYLAEPIRDHAARTGDSPGYDEDTALDFFLRNSAAVAADPERIVIRPHPSEPRGKYDWALDRFPALPLQISDSAALYFDLAGCDVVAGCETMAMAVALTAGKRVISCIPPGGRPCSLPHRAIEHLTAIVARSARV